MGGLSFFLLHLLANCSSPKKDGSKVPGRGPNDKEIIAYKLAVTLDADLIQL